MDRISTADGGYQESHRPARSVAALGDDYVIDNVHVGVSPQALLASLIPEVIALNIRAGIANSFDAKLGAVMAATDDTRQGNQRIVA
jgi:hypothetical protein